LNAPSNTPRALKAALAQRGEDGRGLPAAMRDGGAHPPAAPGAAMAPGHRDGRKGLATEHQPGPVQRRLLRPSGAPWGDDVRAVLLGGPDPVVRRHRRTGRRPGGRARSWSRRNDGVGAREQRMEVAAARLEQRHALGASTWSWVT
jgi:hypothetical protein